MKLVLHGPKAGVSKSKESKTKGKVDEEASQIRKLKQIKSNKRKNMKSHSSDLSKKKSPSSVKSPAKELNGTSETKKSHKNNLNSVGSKEDKNRKRKREEEQKKSKSKSAKSDNQKEKHKKENIVAVKNSNSEMVSPVQSPSRKRIAENGTKDHDVKPKKPKITATAIGKPLSSVGDKPSQKAMMGSKSSKSEQSKKEQTENFTDKKLKTYSRKSKPGTTAKDHSSVSRKEEAESSRSNGQTKNAVQRKSPSFPLAKSVNINQSRQDVKRTMSKATRPEPSTTLVEKSKASIVRKLKVLRSLGLAPPVGSPFVRQEATP